MIQLPYNFQNLDTSQLSNATDSAGDVTGKAVPASYLDANFQQLARVVSVGSTAPDSPYAGMIWLDTANGIIKQYDGTQWVSKVNIANSATNADTVDNYHASQTPTAEGLVASGSNGLIANGWLANSIRSFENPIDTVAYYNQTGQDYPLAVGEVAKITFNNESSKALRIATQNGTAYKMQILCSNNKGTSGGVGNNYLNPNNTTYSSAFRDRMIYQIEGSATPGAQSGTTDAFRLFALFININALIVNFTTSKSVIYDGEIWGSSSYLGNPFIAVSSWQDTTTAWTSLGTLVFGQNTSGYVLVQRIL